MGGVLAVVAVGSSLGVAVVASVWRGVAVVVGACPCIPAIVSPATTAAALAATGGAISSTARAVGMPSHTTVVAPQPTVPRRTSVGVEAAPYEVGAAVRPTVVPEYAGTVEEEVTVCVVSEDGEVPSPIKPIDGVPEVTCGYEGRPLPVVEYILEVGVAVLKIDGVYVLFVVNGQ